jgi:hypothetical protein
MDVKQHVIMKRIEMIFALHKINSGYTDLFKGHDSLSAFGYRCNYSAVNYQWLGTLEPGKMVYDYKARRLYVSRPRLLSGSLWNYTGQEFCLVAKITHVISTTYVLSPTV